MAYMLCSTCGADDHSSRDCPKSRSNNGVAAHVELDIAPYAACIRALQHYLGQLESELEDQIALRAQIKRVDQALKILHGGVIASSVTVDVPDTVARSVDLRKTEEAREGINILASVKRVRDDTG